MQLVLKLAPRNYFQITLSITSNHNPIKIKGKYVTYSESRLP